jgi:hypothetical protein
MRIATIVRADVSAFFEERIFRSQYGVSNPATKKRAIIDPVLDHEERSSLTATCSADAILELPHEVRVFTGHDDLLGGRSGIDGL